MKQNKRGDIEIPYVKWLLPVMLLQNVLLFSLGYLLLWHDWGVVPPPASPSLPLPAEPGVETLWVPTPTGERLEAWLYRPSESSGSLPPLVLMAHGMNAQKDMLLPRYAARFQRRGLAVLLFDYRGFGGSEGPRQVVDAARHIEDWLSALRHAENDIEGVDGANVGLWGTSYSGGHVLAVAARAPDRVKCLSSQVAYVDPWAALGRIAAWDALRLALLGARDLLFQMVGLPRVYVKAYADGPEDLAVLKGAIGVEALKKTEARGGWENKMTARATLAPLYSPKGYADRVRCPALFGVAARDEITPPEPVRRLAGEMGADLFEADTTHFGFYLGDAFEMAVERQGEFFERHLLKK